MLEKSSNFFKRVRNEALKKVKEEYSDFKPKFASEKLEENHLLNIVLKCA